MTLNDDHKMLERLRGWGLMALYGTLSMFAALLIYAGFQFLPSYTGDYVFVQMVGLCGFGGFSVIASFISARKIWLCLKAETKLPTLDLTPFAGILGTILIASYLFATVSNGA